MVHRSRDPAVRWWPAVRQGLVHPATAGIAFVVVTILHVRWFERSSHAGEVISGYGAALVMLGVFVGSRPYIRAGVQRMIADGLPQDSAGVFGGPLYEAGMEKLRGEARPGVTLDVWTERVVAVAIVLLGTFLNGYGTPLARRWGLPV